ncbi:MAG: hypothetical protein Q9226_001271 [Calogaya cf. arnoldii]
MSESQYVPNKGSCDSEMLTASAKADFAPAASSSQLSTNTATTTSPILRLPLELRLKIYRPILVSSEPHILFLLPTGHLHAVHETSPTRQVIVRTPYQLFWKSQFWEEFPAERTALLFTCRQIYAEAINLLYQETVFIIKHTQLLHEFSATIASRQLQQIRHLRIELNAFSTPHLYSCSGRNRSELSDPDLKLLLSRQTRFQYEYEEFWNTIAGMKGLENLSVQLDYRRDSHLRSVPPPPGQCCLWQDTHVEDCRHVLWPLTWLKEKGLKVFELELMVQRYNIGYPVTGSLPVTEGTTEMVKEILKGALEGVGGEERSGEGKDKGSMGNGEDGYSEVGLTGY